MFILFLYNHIKIRFFMLSKLIDIATSSLIEKSSFISGIKHPGEKGMFREFFISEILSPLLPHHYGLTSGIIVDANNNQSNQLDVIIYDKRKLPPLLMRDGAGIIPLDSALIVIEVKSTLTSKDLKTSLASAIKLNPTFNSHLEMTQRNSNAIYPLYSIFAYDSDAITKSEFDRVEDIFTNDPKNFRSLSLYQQMNKKGSEALPLISVLNKGLWVRTKVGGIEQDVTYSSSDKYKNMRNFIWMLLDKIESTADSRAEFKITDWFKFQ